MKKLSIVSLLSLGALAISAPLQAKSVGYWYDTSGDIVRTGFGECWRTIRWSSDNAIAECEGGVEAASAKPAMKKATTEADSDNDGIVDSKDQCPASAAGIIVDAKGCAKDSDKDGVIDSMDNCPNSAANAQVDRNGCAVSQDDDKDGIANSKDNCPNSKAGAAVNTQGCEIKAAISLNNVQFKTGTAVLNTESRNILDNVAQTLKANSHLSFEVAGHTDNTGNYQNNVNLSDKRAKSVRQYLISKGVAADRLSARGYGPDKPVASNNTREGRSQNRRVELVLNK